MTAVLPEASLGTFILVYGVILLPVLVALGFEIAERVIGKMENRRPHRVLTPWIALASILWVTAGLAISDPIANYFHQSSFHSQIEKELEVKNLVSSDDSEIELCTRDLVDTKIFEVRWKERKSEYKGTLSVSPNGNNSCVYQLEKSSDQDY